MNSHFAVVADQNVELPGKEDQNLLDQIEMPAMTEFKLHFQLVNKLENMQDIQ